MLYNIDRLKSRDAMQKELSAMAIEFERIMIVHIARNHAIERLSLLKFTEYI